jgi:hypothetical protein
MVLFAEPACDGWTGTFVHKKAHLRGFGRERQKGYVFQGLGRE